MAGWAMLGMQNERERNLARKREREMDVRVQLRRAAMRYADHLSRCERELTDEETALLDGFVAQQTRELTRDLRLHANAWP